MPDEQQLRLFVACELSAEVQAALGRLQDDLRRSGTGRLRWVRPQGIHITLKFLGDVDEARVDELCAALAQAIEPFELRLSASGELGGFGGARLRVVWVGLAGDLEPLAELARRVEEALEPLGFAREGRRFTAHLTLARVPDAMPPADRQRLADLLRSHRSVALPPMVVTEVALMRSVLRPGGSEYSRIATFPSAVPRA